MLESGQEEKRRKFSNLDGTWIQLANGDKFCVPSIPASKEKSSFFIEKMKNLEKMSGAVDELAEHLETANLLGTKALQLNYNISDDDCNGLFRIAHIPALLQALNGEQQIRDLIKKKSGEEQSTIEKKS